MVFQHDGQHCDVDFIVDEFVWFNTHTGQPALGYQYMGASGAKLQISFGLPVHCRIFDCTDEFIGLCCLVLLDGSLVRVISLSSIVN